MASINRVNFFRSYWEAAEDIPENLQGAYFKMILGYLMDGVEPDVYTLDPILKVAWRLLRPTLDRSRNAMGAQIKPASAPDSRTDDGGQAQADESTPVREATADGQVTLPEPILDDASTLPRPKVDKSLSYKEKEKDKGIRSKEKEREGAPARATPPKFSPPSLEEVKAYVTEKGYHFSPDAFWAFYASKGWKVGRAPMTNWRAACTTWETRDNKQGKPGKEAHLDFDGYDEAIGF